jgi:hypothetical protein
MQSPSWAANWFAASQEIPSISRNPEVHYSNHKRPPPVSILGQPNPVHIPTSHLLQIHPNIIQPSTPRSPQWFFPSGFPTKILHTPLSSPVRATRPAHLILLDFITRTILGEVVINTYSTETSSENSQGYAVHDHRTRELKCPSGLIVYDSGSLYCTCRNCTKACWWELWWNCSL